jgi:hypothetical protein
MWQDKVRVTLTMTKIRSLGVGKYFLIPRISFDGETSFGIVNPFHPRLAVNYNPQVSCFRQLLFLGIVKACRVYEGSDMKKSG